MSAVAPAVEPTFVQPKPYAVELEPGKTYSYCTCGLSKNQPFCDGSHKGTGMKSTKFTVDEKKTYYMCGCKATSNPEGFCDGTHRKEAGIKKYNTHLLKANTELRDSVSAYQKREKALYAIATTGLAASLVGLIVSLRLLGVFNRK